MKKEIEEVMDRLVSFIPSKVTLEQDRDLLYTIYQALIMHLTGFRNDVVLHNILGLPRKEGGNE